MPRRYVTVLQDGVQKQEHRVIWEKVHGPIPKGYEIHHKNGDGRDNRLENLQMLTSSEHRYLHAQLRKEGCDVVDPNDPRVKSNRDSSRRYYETHREELLAKNKIYRVNNKERCAERGRKWAAENREKVREYGKKSYRKNIEKITAKHRAYRESHYEEYLAYSKRYNDAHREEHMAYNAAHKDEHDKYNHEYYQSHKEIVKAQAKLYRAVKKGKPQDEIDAIRKEIALLKESEKRKYAESKKP